MLNRLRKNKVLLILFSIILISSLWLLTSGMPYSHDIEFHYGRLIGLTNSIKNGDILALIHDYFYGYGYATGLFYSNFYFYISSFLNILGLSTLSSLKVLYFLINVFTTISIFYVLKSITKDKKISIFGTILYMFSNYRLVDIYVRGAIGEMLAFMIAPVVILGIYEILYRNYRRWYLFTISFVLLLLCHLITTFLVAVFIALIVIFSYKKLINDKVRIKYLILSSIIGILLGAFFFFPILEQKISGNINIFKGENIHLPQDEIVSWINFLIPTNFFNKYLGFSLVLLLPIRYFVKNDDDNLELIKFSDMLYILSIICWISTTSIFPWNLVGNTLHFIQFPWRLLIISTIFLTISYSVYFKFINNKKVLKYAYYVIIIFSLLEICLYSVQYGIRKIQYNKFIENDIGTNEYLLYKTDIDKLEKENIKFTTNNKDLIIDYKKVGNYVKINYENNNANDTYIEIPLFNYLGYSSKEAKMVNGNNNLIRLLLDDKEGSIEVKYAMTNVQKISYLLSSVTLCGLIIYGVREKRKKNGFS